MTLSQKIWMAIQAAPGVSFAHGIWYLVFAGALWLIYYVVLRRSLRTRKIAAKYPTRRQLGWEIGYSLRSLLIFGAVGGFVAFASLAGWTQLYWRIGDYGWPWFFGSIVAMIFIHDAYFYWTHRLIHHRRLFRAIHRTHHLSTSPSPWAAYSFSAPEALLQAGISPLVIFAIPSHPLAFFIFMIWQIAFNVFGHCGFEIFPNSFLRSPLGKFLNTPTHHIMHHESYRANFGLYFNIWDRMVGTNHPHYEERFDQVTGPLPSGVARETSSRNSCMPSSQAAAR